MIGSGEFELHEKAVAGSVTTTALFPKTKRFGSQSRQLRQRLKRGGETEGMSTSSHSSTQSLTQGNNAQTQPTPGKVNNNEDEIFRNGKEVREAPALDGNLHSSSPNAHSSQNVESNFETENQVSVVGNIGSCVSCSEHMRNANHLINTHDNVCARIQNWKDDDETGRSVFNPNDSNSMIGINDDQNFVKTILLRKSRYERGTPPFPTSTSSSMSTSINSPTSNSKSVHFSPGTVFSERNSESPFWIKVEEERKRRRALRSLARNKSETILRLQRSKSRRMVPLFQKQNPTTDSLSTKELLAILAGRSNDAGFRQRSGHQSFSQPDGKCTHFWTTVGFRKSFSNVFTCFSPKIVTTKPRLAPQRKNHQLL